MMQKNADNRIEHTNTSGGFTLIEVLVAVTIFAVALTGLMTVLGTGISDVSVARNKMVGNYLAEEGIELVRYDRDYDALGTNGGGWLTFASGTGVGILNCQSATPCAVSILHPSLPPKPCQVGNGTCAVTVDSATGLYDYVENPPTITATPTIFTRQIYIDPPTGQDFLTIHSLVTWKQGIANYSVSMSETVYNL